MTAASGHTVGLRELRHRTGEIIARVRQGEIIDVTDYGRTVARIVPVEDRKPTPILERLITEGRVTRASRPGYRPRMRAAEGKDRLSDALAASREEERW